MVDLSTLSDDELTKMYRDMKSANDLSSMSDDELMALYKQKKGPSFGETFQREAEIQARGVSPILAGAGAGAAFGSLGGPVGTLVGGVGGGILGAMPKDSILGGISNLSDYVYDKLGFAEPETPDERIRQQAGRGAAEFVTGARAGASALRPAISSIEQSIARMLTEAPAAQLAGSAVGPAVSQQVKEEGGSESEQLLSGLLASMAPSEIINQGGNIFRSVLRGSSSPKTMQENISMFNLGGMNPTVGQASQSRPVQGIESLLSRAPGSHSYMANRAEREAGKLGQRVEDIAEGLTTREATPETAGAAIISGVRNDYIPAMRGVQRDLYGKLDDFIKPESMVSSKNFGQTLSEITSPIPRAKNLSEAKILKNNIAEDLSARYFQDAYEGQLPYEALKDIRTRIGQQLESVDLAPDMPRAQLKQLYGSLTKDMEEAARSAGPKAYKAFQEANAYTRNLHEKLDVLDSVINRNGGPEKVFKAAMSGTQDGASTLRTVMDAMTSDGKKLMTSTILKRMGKATPGNQNDVGNVFSVNTFLTNWNRLSPEAKKAIIEPHGEQFAKDLDIVAGIADNLKSGSKIYANPSGTSAANAQIGTIGAGIYSVLSGDLATAGTVGAIVGSSNVAARLLSSPSFVRWLAQNNKKPISSLPAAVNSYVIWATNKGNEEDKMTAEELKRVQQSIGGDYVQ